MAKILVIYDSNSGNTEKMALAVAKGAKAEGDLEVTMKKASETKPSDLLAANGIIMGSPTYFGQMSAKLKAVIDQSEQVHKQLGGKVGGAFTSSGGTASGAETTLLSIVHTMLIHGMIVQGRADDAHYGVAVMGTPSKEDLAECEELGRRVATLVLRLNQC
jgi:NAD(P)H dehydrogenase (quinone)